jgi:cyanate permease
MMCVVSTLAAVGPAVGGIERDHSGNFVAMFATLAAIAIAMAAVLLLTRRPYRRGDALLALSTEFA